MAAEPLDLRRLNRALLARQMLLMRERVTPLRAVQRLAGMQAQLPRPPFVGLWTRVEGFSRAALAKQIERRKVVRATAMRCTIHLMSAKDYATLRPALQPALTRAMRSALRKRADGLDVEKLVRDARAWFLEEPRTFEELRAHLAKRRPKDDVRAMAYAIRTQLPLVQVPSEDTWSYPRSADFALADAWLDKPVSTKEAKPSALIERYLAAFGPATVADAQTWSGLAGLRAAFDELRPRLRTFRDERGRELFDLKKAPLPDPRSAAPVRFLPDFDNVVLAHDDRSRVIADEHRSKVCLANLRVLPTFLVDGFVAGTWKTERKRAAATLTVKPFGALSRRAKTELTQEGRALLSFVEPDAERPEVRFEKA